MPYQQTTTANPYGFRPWRTRLYTTFDDYSYLKQPQNTILREDLKMRPEIYKPPEMRGLGDILVTGSGRTIRGRRHSLRGLGLVISSDPFAVNYPAFTDVYRPAIGVRPMPGPMPVAPIIVRGPISTAPPPPPTMILPPSIVPPPPTLVTSSPDGTVYSLPGAAGVPGSPFPPPAPGELPAPGAPVTPTTTVSTGGSLSDWFNSQTLIAGIPNGYLALGGAAALWFLSKRGRR